MQKISKILPLVVLLLTACRTAVSSHPTPNNTFENLTFECKHEVRPPLSPETQQLYNYAYYHDLHNMWKGKKGDQTWQQTAVYYRIAAYNGDYKANIRLQYLLETGRVTRKNCAFLPLRTPT